MSPTDQDLPEKFRDHPTMDYVDGQWKQNLSKLEEWYWRGLQEFRDHDAARVYLTFRCVSQEAAQELVDRLKAQPAESVEMRFYGGALDKPPVSSDQIRTQLELLSKVTGIPTRPDARIIILDSGAGWRIEAKSQVIEERSQLSSLFDHIRILVADSRWTLEGSGIGP